MKANTFVKKYGWTEAQDVVKNAHWENAYSDGSYYSHIDSENNVLLSDLKRWFSHMKSSKKVRVWMLAKTYFYLWTVTNLNT